MPSDPKRPLLRIEGKDDKFALATLLTRHDINYDSKPWPANYPEFIESGGVTEMLDGMKLSIEAAGRNPIGFVLDADSPLQNRWEAVCDRLREVGFKPPSIPPADGFCEYTKKHKTTVGVWLMPDNQQDGKLETFLRTLIDENDGLIEHATASTRQAKELGSRFSDPNSEKAVLHAWLAWQEEPGCPFGTAIKARFFTHESPAAAGFVDWFKRLYKIS
ncbi:MAG: DUF3226 domain-containing protein [Planctomycetota bacterium]|nr:DUF3226 domain-containing protein [Planctomycetota bacterium]